MAGRSIIMMSRRELKRLHVIQKVLEKRLKQKEAADILGLKKRQIIRIVKRVREEGDTGIIHRSRGRESNRSLSEELKENVRKIYRKKYWDFGPTLASEKLFEIDKIKLSNETLRLWLLESGDWKKSRKGRKHRKWRERKHHCGQMLQGDGSHHDWFEGRGPKSVLMGYIDDATSQVYAGFYEYEGTMPAMDSFKRYINKYGIPQSIYMDNHSTYKNKAKLTVEEELEGRQNPLSQFERAVEELGVRFIHAQSAPAKGRIERLFRTFQDRVIKEMRLAGISSIEEGNKFLKEYLPKYNKRFSISAIEKEDLHRPLTEDEDIDSKLCIKEERVLRNDYTISYKTHLYQILVRTRAKKITIEERISGRIVISYKGEVLKHKEVVKRPVEPVEQKQKGSQKSIYIPSKDHPWRRNKQRSYPQNYVYQQKEKSSKKEKELLLVH
jgi:transposase